jgi:hypothetical protein
MKYNLRPVLHVLFYHKDLAYPGFLVSIYIFLNFLRTTCGTYQTPLQHASVFSYKWKALMDGNANWNDAPLAPQYCTRT